jgi:hypothetical protein
MDRILLALWLLFAFTASAAAEEIVLKDGTKIVGRMTAVSGDKIEVETSYGKMSLKRGDILTITFPENATGTAQTGGAAPKEMPKIEESMDATQYVNKTGKFTLTLPLEWKINPSLRFSAAVMAGLSSRDNMRYLMVMHEEYPGSLESYKGLIEIQAKHNLQDYEKLTESPTTIDGKAAVLVSYRGTTVQADNLPIQFLTAIIPDGNNYFRITTWCVEPLFNDSQAIFEKIISSYHYAGDSSVSEPNSKH